MVKCAVTACQNRVSPDSRGDSSRAKKRFFRFPADPARVKVWLAALRQTEDHECTRHRHICEDHFLPEDVTCDGISRDAIPIMPPGLDEHLGGMRCWREEVSEEQEQEANNSSKHDGGEDTAAATQRHHQKSSPKRSSQKNNERVDLNWTVEKIQKKSRRKAVPLKLLMQRFLQMLLVAPGGSLDIRDAAHTLGCRQQRLSEFRHIMSSLELIELESAGRIRWISEVPILSFLWRFDLFHSELEEMLDSGIRSCSEQLFTITDDQENAAMAYVTHGDISHIPEFQDQSVIIIKAPEETTMKVLLPKEDRIQVHLKGAGPITGQTSSSFVSLEESHMTTTMETGSKDSVQSVSI